MSETQAGGTGPVMNVDGDGIAWIVFDDPDRPLNVLTEAVMGRLSDVVGQARELVGSREVRAVVLLSGKRGSFVAGADIGAIGGIEDPVEGERASLLGQAVFFELESLSVPTVAAIDGICLGGGTEMALACTYRLASDAAKTKLGLPEVRLGILPAWGGTTRLPRLIGLQAALDMLLKGTPVQAPKALRIGLVDRVLPAPTFHDEVAEFVRELLSSGPGPARRKRGLLRRLGEDTAPGRRVILAAAKKRVQAATGGHYPAPLAILRVLRGSLGNTLEKAFRIEAAAAGELLVSEVSKNLIHVFRMQERAKKLPRSVQAEPLPVDRLGVVGAGVMGGGIAQITAYNGVDVRLKDIRHDAVAAGLSEARARFKEAVDRRKLTRMEADQRMELIAGSVGYEGFGTADLVIEAVVERLDVKRSVLGELEGEVGDDCVIATNTSSLSVTDMAKDLSLPERFCGLHFFNPVHRMPLVEIVRGAKTSDRTLATVHAFARRLGKVSVIVDDGPGFLVNRILGPYLNEAGWLLVDGSAGPDVDRAARQFGLPMGPLRLIDEVGIDVAGHAGKTLHEALGDRLEPAPSLVAMGESGRLGRKGGLGFYRYPDGEKETFDDEVYGVMGEAVPETRTGPKARTIRGRLILAMINEGARVLEDQVAGSAEDVDLAMIMGTGFPPFRGGLLRYADSLHLKTILDRLRELEATVGPRFTPAHLIVELAGADRGFYDAFPG